MAYEYTEWDQQPEPEASSSRGGGPPRKNTGIGILDPPLPPTSRNPRFAATPFLGRIIALVILIVMAVAALLLLSPHH
jgi:hypothetical protein